LIRDFLKYVDIEKINSLIVKKYQKISEVSMKKVLLFLLFSNLILLSQDEYQLTWKLSQLPFMPPQTSSEVAIVKAGFDTDKDGKKEFLIAWTDLDENYIIMYEANGNNTFDTVWSWKYPVPSNTFAGIAIGDLDGNGRQEIITTLPSQVGVNPNPPRLWVFEWNGIVGENKYGIYTSTQGPLPHLEWNFNLPDNIDFRPYSLVAEDVDGDGKQELVVGVRQGGRGREVLVCSLEGEVGGFSSWIIEYNLQGLTGGSLYSVTTGDLDNDGKKEIYAFIWNKFTLYIIEATGIDQYQLVDSLKQLYTTDYGALDGVRVADVNNDGINEMYIAGTESDNTIFVISNIADVSQITANDVKILMNIPAKPNTLGRLRAMYVADMDGDGKPSLMIAGERNGQIFDVEYKGSGNPADSTSWDVRVAFDIFQYSGISPSASPTLSPRLFYGYPGGDLDGDGKREYAFVNYSSDFSVWQDDGYVFIIENQTVTNVEDENLNVKGYYLAQNYPNPFNPLTNIKFQIGEDGFVNLSVFNIMGQKIKDILNEFRKAGKYSVLFDASDLTSGVYFYTMKANNFTQTRKLLLIK